MTSQLLKILQHFTIYIQNKQIIVNIIAVSKFLDCYKQNNKLINKYTVIPWQVSGKTRKNLFRKSISRVFCLCTTPNYLTDTCQYPKILLNTLLATGINFY